MDVRIPKLRFKEFSAEWQQRHLSDISSIITGNTPSTSDRSLYGDEHLFVSPADMGNGRYVNETQTMLTQKGFDKTRKVPSGSTLFVCIGSTIGKLSQTAVDCATNQQINAVVPNTVIDPNFMYLSLERIASKIAILAGIQAVPIINKTDFSKNKIYLPNIQEQQKIADFLTTVDEKIAKLEEKKAGFEKYKKGVMQAIFSQKIRFKKPDGTDYPDWEEKKLRDILIEENEKTKESKQYPTLSSTAKGLFRQDEYFNKEIASADSSGYKILKMNQLVFSPQNLWLGNINVNRKYQIGIVSPSYKIFNFTNCDIAFCENLMKSNRMMYEYAQASEQGASVVRRNLDFDSFMSIKIHLPGPAEQVKIGEYYSILDLKINLLNKELGVAKEFKKALLQQMFV